MLSWHFHGTVYYSPKFSLLASNGQLRATCDLRAAFPIVHHFTVQSLRLCNSSQSILIFNIQSSFVSWLNLVTSLFVYSFPAHVCLPRKQHISPGDTTADQPLPQDLTMSSHSLFPRFFIHSFFIHPGTFPFMPWLFLKAFSERCCLQVSGNKSWFYQQDILYPKAHWHLQRTPVGPYGRTSLYKSHADFSTAHHRLPMCPLIQYFSLVSTKQHYNTNLHLASCAAERDKTSC